MIILLLRYCYLRQQPVDTCDVACRWRSVPPEVCGVAVSPLEIYEISASRNGGRVLENLTSPTFTAQKTLAARLWQNQELEPECSRPDRLLSKRAPNYPRQSWCFKGSSGRLTVHFARPVAISHIAVTGPPVHDLDDKWPRDLELWAFNKDELPHIPLDAISPQALNSTYVAGWSVNAGIHVDACAVTGVETVFDTATLFVGSNGGGDFTCIRSLEIFGYEGRSLVY